MKYGVYLTPKAEQDLALVWVNSKDRNTVTSAVNLIDELLSDMPQSVGEVCFDAVRSLVVTPLGVDYEVIEDDHIVYVLSVWDALSRR